MTTWLDVDDMEKQLQDLKKSNGHLLGEVSDAIRIVKAFRRYHDNAKAGKCRCSDCLTAESFLARNGQ